MGPTQLSSSCFACKEGVCLAKRTKKKKQRKSGKAPSRAQRPDTSSRKRSLIWRFLLVYVFLMGLFLLLIGLEPIKNVLDINGLYTRMIIFLSISMLKPFDIVQTTSGSVIALPGLSLDIKFGCNGLEAFFIYLAGVLAFPARASKKIWGIVGGFLALQIFNVLRIAGLALSGIYLESYFEIIHIYVAQGIMIAIAFIMFLIWLHYVTEA